MVQLRTCGEKVAEVEIKPDGSWGTKADGDVGHWYLPDGSLIESLDI